MKTTDEAHGRSHEVMQEKGICALLFEILSLEQICPKPESKTAQKLVNPSLKILCLKQI